MNIEQCLSMISDALLGLSAIVVAVVAIMGLYAWRRELKGRVLFDVARKIMRLSIELKDNFEWARFPLSNSNESLGRQKADNESEGESQIKDQWYARRNRLKPVIEGLQKLQGLDWEIQALLGEKAEPIANAIKVYRECYANLTTAIDDYFDRRIRAVLTNSPSIDSDYDRELLEIIYGRSVDGFSKKIDAAHEELLKALYPLVK